MPPPSLAVMIGAGKGKPDAAPETGGDTEPGDGELTCPDCGSKYTIHLSPEKGAAEMGSTSDMGSGGGGGMDKGDYGN